MKSIENESVGVGTVRPLITTHDLIAAGRFGCSVWAIPGRLTPFIAGIGDNGATVVECAGMHSDWDYMPVGWSLTGEVMEGSRAIADGLEFEGAYAVAVREPVDVSGPRFAYDDERPCMPVARVAVWNGSDFAVMLAIAFVVALWLFAAYKPV